jgi:diadenosine tetraphosphate (Ap4A) HIT family hydrolase
MTKNTFIETNHLTIKYPTTGLIPGYMIITTKGEIYSLADLSPAARTHMIDTLAQTHKLLNKVIAPQRIYTLSIGEIEPRLHFHVFPRTRTLLEAYKTANPDQTGGINGLHLFDWARTTYSTQPFGEYEAINFKLKKQLETLVVDIKR